MKTKKTSLLVGITGTIIFVFPIIWYYSIKIFGDKKDIKIFDSFPIDDFKILTVVFILLVAWETFKIKLASRKTKQE